MVRRVVFVIAAAVTACGSAGNGSEPQVTTTPAISASSQRHAVPHSNRKDFSSRPSAGHRPVGEFIHFPQPRPIPPMEHPGLRANKVVKKPDAPTEPGRRETTLPAVSLDVQRKQAAYLSAWEEQRASLGDIDATERERRRADLKRKLLGE